MAILLCLRWWYGAGWNWIWQRMMIDRFVRTGEVFSMKALANTLFAPYRQTFAGGGKGSLEARFRALIDNAISRIIGVLVRSLLLLTGTICCLGILAWGLGVLVLWAFIPFMPLISLVLWGFGWMA